jgi:membrane-associated phospholipid phosphatase
MPVKSKKETLNAKLLLMFLNIGIMLLYFPLNKMITSGVILKLPIDNNIPTLSIFVIPYCLFFAYVYLFLLVSLRLSLKQYQQITLAFIIASCVSYLVFIFYPTYVESIHLNNHTIFDSLVNWIYSVDRRFNAFPSGHVFYTTLCAIYILKWERRFKLIYLPLAVLIILSTVFIKQHYTPDIIGGLVLAFISVFLAEQLIPAHSLAHQKNS